MESKNKVRMGRKDRLLMTRAVTSPKTLGTLSEFEMRRVMAGAIELLQVTYQKWATLPENARIAKQAKETPQVRSWLCGTCDELFLADGIFDAMRQIELQLHARGRGGFALSDDVDKWVLCPKCWSNDVDKSEVEEEVEAGSIETVKEVAGEMLDDLKSKLPRFEKSEKALIECMDLLWSLCATMSRGCELARENAEWSRGLAGDSLGVCRELVRKFGREKGVELFKWFEKDKIRPPVQMT
jgi:hypothetical protein